MVEVVDTIDLLDCTEERRMVLYDDGHVRVMKGCQSLSLLRSLCKFTNMVLQSMSDQIQVSYISEEHEKLLSAPDIIVLICHSSFPSTIIKPDNRLMDIVHSVMNSAVKFELEYDVELLHAHTSNIVRDMLSLPRLMQHYSFYRYCRFNSVAKWLKNNDVFTFFTEQCNRSSAATTWVTSISTALPSSRPVKSMPGCWSWLQPATSTTPLFLPCSTHNTPNTLDIGCSLHNVIFTIGWTGRRQWAVWSLLPSINSAILRSRKWQNACLKTLPWCSNTSTLEHNLWSCKRQEAAVEGKELKDHWKGIPFQPSFLSLAHSLSN